MTYQGWANHATWVVHLHLANDEGLYFGAKGAIARLPTKDFAADELEAFVLDLFDDIDLKISNPATLMRSDLIQSALNEVDWDSIVEALTEE